MGSLKIKILKIAFISLIVFGLITIAVFSLTGPSKHYDWYKGLKGYKSALQLSQQIDSAMLIYVRKKNCFYCDKFEEELLSDALVQVHLDPLLKVKIVLDESVEQLEVFNDTIPLGTFPALYVRKSPQHPAISTHLLMETSQIWVSKPSYQRGNFMPISSVTLPLSIKTALIESEAQGQN